jgi:predicted nucleic acid-binding protein
VIFIDTGAFLGRYLERDDHHVDAVRGFRLIAERKLPVVTSCHVLDETISLLGRWAGRRFAAERGRAILASGTLRILRPELRQETAALREFARFADQSVSFTDCLSFVLMNELGIRRAFTFDSDFRLAGFTLWPGDGE